MWRREGELESLWLTLHDEFILVIDRIPSYEGGEIGKRGRRTYSCSVVVFLSYNTSSSLGLIQFK